MRNTNVQETGEMLCFYLQPAFLEFAHLGNIGVQDAPPFHQIRKEEVHALALLHEPSSAQALAA